MRGTRQDQSRVVPVRVTPLDGTQVSALWARKKVGHLSRQLSYGTGNGQDLETIKQLGLRHRLVTRLTSMVAVDRERTVTGELRIVVQPVEAPEGVDPIAAGVSLYRPSHHRSRIGRPSRSGGSGGGGRKMRRSSSGRASGVDDHFDAPRSHSAARSTLSKSDIMAGIHRNARTLGACVAAAQKRGELAAASTRWSSTG